MFRSLYLLPGTRQPCKLQRYIMSPVGTVMCNDSISVPSGALPEMIPDITQDFITQGKGQDIGNKMLLYFK